MREHLGCGTYVVLSSYYVYTKAGYPTNIFCFPLHLITLQLFPVLVLLYSHACIYVRTIENGFIYDASVVVQPPGQAEVK